MRKLFAFTVILGMLASCGEKEEQYTVPITYQFTDANGNNTVSYSGQTTRFNQLSELTTYMKTANTPGTALSEAQLLEMYSNNNGLGSQYFSATANATDKQLREKTARGETLIIDKFDNRLKDLAATSTTTTTDVYGASLGTAGVLQSGTSAYLVDQYGMEYTQLIEKGLMGAVFYDQIQNVYLGAEKMAFDNTTSVDEANGKYYTGMEHNWDEAYGYFTDAVDFPASGTDRFWGKYSTTVNGLLNTNDNIAQAFRKGRAAITNKDYSTRDSQISIIRAELEKVAVGTAIHYLNEGIASFTDDAIRCHVLSEAAAFMEALYFTHSSVAIVTGTTLDTYLSVLKDTNGNYDFYNITLQEITELRDNLAVEMGFENFKTAL